MKKLSKILRNIVTFYNFYVIIIKIIFQLYIFIIIVKNILPYFNYYRVIE